jgi:hypothetical protein
MSLPAARARGAWSLRAWLRAAVSPVRALQPTVTTWSWSNVAALPPPPRPEAIFAMADAVIARVDDDIARAVERAINHTAPRWTHVRVRHDPCFVTVSAKCRRCGAIFSTAWARGLVAAASMDARDACADAYGGAIARIGCYCVAREPDCG